LSFKKSCLFFYNLRLLTNDELDIQSVLVRLYEHRSRYSILQTCRETAIKGPDGTVGLHTFLEMVTPIHDDCDDIILESETLDPHSNIYCFAIAFVDVGAGTMGRIFLTVDKTHVDVVGNRTKFSVALKNSEALTQIIRNYARSGAGNKVGN